MKMGQELIFWKHRCSDFRRYSDSLASIPDISTLETRPDYTSILNNRFSLSYSLNNLHAARYSLDECHLSAAQLRHDHLTEGTRHSAITFNTSVETALNNILTAESATATFRKLKKYAKGEIRSSLQRVEAPDMDSNQNPTGQTLSIAEPLNRSATITAQNISHFSQAMDTPGVSGTLGTVISPFTRNEITTSILQGSYDLTNIDPMPEIRQFLQAMAIPPELQDTDPVDIAISTLDFQKGFKKLPDKTLSSPSGCHMTHYKLLAKDNGLSHILAWAITLHFQHGFSPTTWRTAIQFMSEKEPGNPLITKLRMLQLLEADMNIAFRLLWGKRHVQHTLAQNALTPLNFGGRPGCRVHSALPLRTLSYNYIRYTCLNAIIFNNDTMACFDRIISSIGLMATEHHGMPPTASACMLATIQGMKFFINTTHYVLDSSHPLFQL